MGAVRPSTYQAGLPLRSGPCERERTVPETGAIPRSPEVTDTPFARKSPTGALHRNVHCSPNPCTSQSLCRTPSGLASQKNLARKNPGPSTCEQMWMKLHLIYRPRRGPLGAVWSRIADKEPGQRTERPSGGSGVPPRNDEERREARSELTVDDQHDRTQIQLAQHGLGYSVVTSTDVSYRSVTVDFR